MTDKQKWEILTQARDEALRILREALEQVGCEADAFELLCRTENDLPVS